METDLYRPFAVETSLSSSLTNDDIIVWISKAPRPLHREWGLKTKAGGLAVVSPSATVCFEFIISSMCLDCYYQDLTTLFESHFLNTSNCLILSASFMWAEKPGIENMSSNYAQQEVPTKTSKQTACVRLLLVSASSCTSRPLSPSLAAVFIFLFDPSLYP